VINADGIAEVRMASGGFKAGLMVVHDANENFVRVGRLGKYSAGMLSSKLFTILGGRTRGS